MYVTVCSWPHGSIVTSCIFWNLCLISYLLFTWLKWDIQDEGHLITALNSTMASPLPDEQALVFFIHYINSTIITYFLIRTTPQKASNFNKSILLTWLSPTCIPDPGILLLHFVYPGLVPGVSEVHQQHQLDQDEAEGSTGSNCEPGCREQNGRGENHTTTLKQGCIISAYCNGISITVQYVIVMCILLQYIVMVKLWNVELSGNNRMLIVGHGWS